MILDCVGGETEQWAVGALKPWSGAKYVTLVTPFLLNTDSMGLLEGTFNAGFTLHSKVIQVNMSKTNLIPDGKDYTAVYSDTHIHSLANRALTVERLFIFLKYFVPGISQEAVSMGVDQRSSQTEMNT